MLGGAKVGGWGSFSFVIAESPDAESLGSHESVRPLPPTHCFPPSVWVLPSAAGGGACERRLRNRNTTTHVTPMISNSNATMATMSRMTVSPLLRSLLLSAASSASSERDCKWGKSKRHVFKFEKLLS